MGFLSKLMKKAKPLLPFAAMMGMGPLMGMFGSAGAMSGIGSLFGGMNPIAANFLKQGAMNYGLGKLTGQKHPEKGALWAGLASVPFSMYGGAQAAQQFNKARGLSQGDKGYQNMWDVLSSNKPRQISLGSKFKPRTSYVDSPVIKPTTRIGGHKQGDWFDVNRPSVSWESVASDADRFGRVRMMPTGEKTMFDAPRAPSLFEKPTTYKMTGDKLTTNPWFGGMIDPEGGTSFNMIPTLASQAAGLYGGRMTPEEEWAATKEKRRKELAWMYGVDPDQIEGEMANPWYGGGGMWNRGGIASLENGGDVSGPGTGTSDSINANLSDGEFVMTARAVENLGGGDRYAGARQMYDIMNVLDPESETMSEVT